MLASGCIECLRQGSIVLTATIVLNTVFRGGAQNQVRFCVLSGDFFGGVNHSITVIVSLDDCVVGRSLFAEISEVLIKQRFFVQAGASTFNQNPETRPPNHSPSNAFNCDSQQARDRFFSIDESVLKCFAIIFEGVFHGGIFSDVICLSYYSIPYLLGNSGQSQKYFSVGDRAIAHLL